METGSQSSLRSENTQAHVQAWANNTVNDAEDSCDEDDNQALDLLSPLSGSMRGFDYGMFAVGSVRGSAVFERATRQNSKPKMAGSVPKHIPAVLEDIRHGNPDIESKPFIQPAIQRDLSPSPIPSCAEKTPTAGLADAPTIKPSPSSSSVTESLPPVPSVMTSLPIQPVSSASLTQPAMVPPPRARSPYHAAATPRSTLLFAIASDDPAAVERVLASGNAAPNDDVGPQSALEFALRNESLAHKTEIVKVLLAYGANPAAVKGVLGVGSGLEEGQMSNKAKGKEKAITDNAEDCANDRGDTQPDAHKRKESTDIMNPAMKYVPMLNCVPLCRTDALSLYRYYLSRAAAPQSAQSLAIRRSFYRPLTRIRFDFVGQDRALEQLYWVLGMHSQQHMVNPLVVMCCGPSGHGKSLLARKCESNNYGNREKDSPDRYYVVVGSLLDVPTHTVNMTILQTSHDLWQCPSMSPYEVSGFLFLEQVPSLLLSLQDPSDRTLAEFLTENEGKRCVVVLDEIDKNEDEKNLWSLLAPWELGDETTVWSVVIH